MFGQDSVPLSHCQRIFEKAAVMSFTFCPSPVLRDAGQHCSLWLKRLSDCIDRFMSLRFWDKDDGFDGPNRLLEKPRFCRQIDFSFSAAEECFRWTLLFCKVKKDNDSNQAHNIFFIRPARFHAALWRRMHLFSSSALVLSLESQEMNLLDEKIIYG